MTEGNVTVIDGASGRVITTVAAGATAICYNPQRDKAYCAGGASVTVIDGVTNMVRATIPTVLDAVALCYNPVNDRIYCATYRGGNITVIDGAGNTIIATVTVGIQPGAVGCNTRNNKVYSASGYSREVTVIDGQTNAILATIPSSYSSGAPSCMIPPTTVSSVPATALPAQLALSTARATHC